MTVVVAAPALLVVDVVALGGGGDAHADLAGAGAPLFKPRRLHRPDPFVFNVFAT